MTRNSKFHLDDGKTWIRRISLQVGIYPPGGFYNPHHDTSSGKDEEGFTEVGYRNGYTRHGYTGPRIATLMIYVSKFHPAPSAWRLSGILWATKAAANHAASIFEQRMVNLVFQLWNLSSMPQRSLYYFYSILKTTSIWIFVDFDVILDYS